jgi:phosphoribosylanthranilate isomerase
MFGPPEPADGRTRVKICGITDAEDAVAAIEGGADALGWNFFPGSKRFISPRRAIAIIARLPQPTKHVAVMVNPTFDEAAEIASSGIFAALQLHGAETAAFCRQLAAHGIRFAKAVAVAAQIAEPITDFATDTIVLDSAAAGQFGGSGSVFPWERAVDLRQRYPATRFILAGGLTPENVSEAISLVRPFAVDVTTGVEESPGRKNHARLRAFIAAARGA